MRQLAARKRALLHVCVCFACAKPECLCFSLCRREKDLMWAADSLLHPADAGKVCGPGRVAQCGPGGLHSLGCLF